jgi:hypothetical protein
VLEGLGRLLWEAGVRDERPRQVQLSDGGASWPGLLSVKAGGGHLAVELAAALVVLELVPLVELIQVLRALAGREG